MMVPACSFSSRKVKTVGPLGLNNQPAKPNQQASDPTGRPVSEDKEGRQYGSVG